jgi:hypothetical protein
MVRRIGGPGRRPNHIDPTRPGALEYFQENVGQFLGRKEYYERADFLAKSRMRDDRNKADGARTLNANFGLAMNHFLDRDGNFQDACEIMAEHIGEREFLRIAKTKYGLRDPLE